ncbi:DUF362 domain-containing protein [Candidatus Clostridium radicumherbarum]|uniref:Ferredoxin n=1 Tax=Candidatus Clostridium radicumherbarum TaxID=3381662 RepID=A0ABW8TX91_9CLOT
MDKVALLKCTDYDTDLIEKTIRDGFELLGGEAYINKLIPRDSKVLIKPNMLSVEQAGSPVITHFAVFEAVIRIVKEYTNNISFGDSPGFGDPKRAAERSGLMEVAEKYGVTFEDFKETVHVKLDNSILCKSWDVAKAPYEADVIISLPKLKTHAMAYFTGAIKNQFGCISGTQKALWHTRMPDANNFCKMLLDLNTLVGTSFAILDGIIAMEGNGPKNGSPHKMNTIIMGDSLSAVDSVAVRLIGYNSPLETPTLKEVYDNNWGAVLPEDIEVVGEKIENMKAKNFKLSRKGEGFHFSSPAVSKFLTGMVAPSPSLVSDKCIGCKRCEEVCPEQGKVIKMVKAGDSLRPTWNMKNCIRCFCCQELCPAGAIETKNTVIGRLLKNI